MGQEGAPGRWIPMSVRPAFGPHLRRARIRRDISLETIARETNVPIALWEGLEDNNLVGWPRGIYARAYVREYAELIGVDANETVDEFCRLFPQGDRRQAQALREHAEIVGHQLAWADDLDGRADRRAPASESPRKGASPARARVGGVFVDCCVVLGLALMTGLVLPFGLGTRIVVATVFYYAIHIVSGGDTPATRLSGSHLFRAESLEILARRLRGLLPFGKHSEDPNRGVS